MAVVLFDCSCDECGSCLSALLFLQREREVGSAVAAVVVEVVAAAAGAAAAAIFVESLAAPWYVSSAQTCSVAGRRESRC